MVWPDYEGGNIVNLMSSILKNYGADSMYPELGGLEDVLSRRNVILFIVDGLGYEYVRNRGKSSLIRENLKRELTTVFPSATVCALTTFMTGEPPKQHGLMGWNMYLKEIGSIVSVLPFVIRGLGTPLRSRGIKLESIISQSGIFERMKVRSYIFTLNEFIDDDYNKLLAKNAKRIGYGTLGDLFSKMERVIRNDSERKFMHVYWPYFDSYSHKEGTSSKIVYEYFLDLDRNTELFLKKIGDSDTSLIITADHGAVDSGENDIIRLENHPILSETLVLPLSGEPRAAYCYVKPDKTAQFERYVRNELGRYCHIFGRNELISRNAFGLFEMNKKLPERIGDYILIMKENYIIRDLLLGEREGVFISNHGALTKEEMLVPLSILQT